MRQPTAAARLAAAGQPLARRTRLLRGRLGARLGGSGLLHLLALVLLSLSFARQQGGQPQESPPVEMFYDRPGSAGTTGEPSPSPPPSQSPPRPIKPIPDLQPPQTPLPALEAPAPVPVPQLPEAEPLPQAQPSPQPAHPASQSSSPLSHPMNLSFAPAAPSQRRFGRRSGSNGPVDLSLGPMIQNGKLLTPYASASSIRGVSSDYAEEVGNWIRRHMYYPEDAAQRGEDGPSSVHVVLDRQGRVKSIRLVSSSGSYALDDATQGMFRNAVLPPIPPDMSGDTFDVDLTIDYILIRR